MKGRCLLAVYALGASIDRLRGAAASKSCPEAVAVGRPAVHHDVLDLRAVLLAPAAQHSGEESTVMKRLCDDGNIRRPHTVRYLVRFSIGQAGINVQCGPDAETRKLALALPVR